MMPRFFADMPHAESGAFVAGARLHQIRRLREVGTTTRQCTVHGLRRAYIVARLLALWLDVFYGNAECEIHWFIRSPNAQEDK